MTVDGPATAAWGIATIRAPRAAVDAARATSRALRDDKLNFTVFPHGSRRPCGRRRNGTLVLAPLRALPPRQLCPHTHLGVFCPPLGGTYPPNEGQNAHQTGGQPFRRRWKPRPAGRAAVATTTTGSRCKRRPEVPRMPVAQGFARRLPRRLRLLPGWRQSRQKSRHQEIRA